MSDAQFADGLFIHKPHENAPDFIKCDVSILVAKFTAWLSEQIPDDKGYIKIAIKESKSGSLYAQLDTYVKKGRDDDHPAHEPEQGSTDGESSSLPF